MEAALAGEPPLDFPVPDAVVTGVAVDIFTGRQAPQGCPWTELDAFVVGTEPAPEAACGPGPGAADAAGGSPPAPAGG